MEKDDENHFGGPLWTRRYWQIYFIYICTTNGKTKWVDTLACSYIAWRINLWFGYSYVATVKFDSRNKVPYSALLQALSQVLQQIMTESQEEMRRFHHYLRACLGARFSNIGILAGFVPELGTLLEKPDSSKGISKDAIAIQTDNIEAQNRFLNMYVEIFRSITFWRMITLVWYKDGYTW